MIYVWILDSIFIFPLFNRNLLNSKINNNCAYVTATKVAATVCTRQFFFICEKNYASVDLKLSEDKWSSQHSGASVCYLQDASKCCVPDTGLFVNCICKITCKFDVDTLNVGDSSAWGGGWQAPSLTWFQVELILMERWRFNSETISNILFLSILAEFSCNIWYPSYILWRNSPYTELFFNWCSGNQDET